MIRPCRWGPFKKKKRSCVTCQENKGTFCLIGSVTFPGFRDGVEI